MDDIKLKSFIILMDQKFDHAFKPGEYVSGKCRIVILDGFINLDDFEVKLSGLAQVEWTKHNNTKQETIRYYSRHECVSMTINSTNIQRGFIGNGEHYLTFSFQLPLSGIASSFEGRWGQIQYYVEAVIHEPVFRCVTQPIIVRAPIVVPLKQQSRSLSINDYWITGCCCFSKLIRMKANVNHSGVPLGNSVSINCVIENGSNSSFRLSATLKQKIMYTAENSHRYDKNKIITINSTNLVKPRSTSNDIVMLPIPEIVPVLQNQCPIINVVYSIRIKMINESNRFQKFHIDLPIYVV